MKRHLEKYLAALFAHPLKWIESQEITYDL